MKEAIDGIGKLKMIMIGGHDSSMEILMNFLNGLNIIKKTEYPHYAFNFLLELRKYNDKHYIEIYYNDNLKYNRTMDEFKNTLDKSKYSNFNNYCKAFHRVKANINHDNNTKKFRIKAVNNIIIIFFVIIVFVSIIFIVTKRRKAKLNLNKSIDISSTAKINKEIK